MEAAVPSGRIPRPGGWREVVGPGVIALLAFMFLLGYLISGRTYVLPILEDIAEARPYRAMAGQAFAAGRFPLWSPSFLCGFPLAGWAHASSFYPLGIIFQFWEYNRAAVINLYVHLMIFGIGMYALARALQVARPAAAIAAVMVSFGPMLSYWQLSFLPTVYTSAWAPWVFAFAFRLVRRPRFRPLAGLALAFALQVTGGRYDLITRQTAIMGVMALALLIRRGPGSRAFLWWTIGGLIGVLTVFAIMPMHYEYFHRSVRSLGLSRSYWSAFQKEPHVLALGLFLLSFPSMLTALAGLRHSSRRWLAGGAALAGMLSLLWVWSPGWWSDINYHLPVLRNLVWSNVMLVFAFISMGVLIAEGIQAWSRSEGSVRAVWLALLLSPVLVMAYFGAWWLIKDSLASSRDWGYFTWFLLRGRMISAAALIVAAFGLGAWLLVRRRWAGPGFSPSVPLFFAGFALVDVVVTGWAAAVRKEPYHFAESPASLQPDPRTYLPYRSINLFNYSDWWEVPIPVQAGSEPGARSFDGFISLPLRRYGEFLTLLSPQAMKLDQGKLARERFISLFKEDDFISPAAKELMNFLNVGWVLTGRANIKFGPRYHLRWAPEREFSFLGTWSGVPEGAVWEQRGPGSFTLAVSLLPGGRFRTGLTLSGPERVWIEALARDPDRKLRRLFYSRAFWPEREGSALDLDVPLPVADPVGVAWTGVALPVEGRSGTRAGWRDPMLVNDSQPFGFVSEDAGVSVFRNPEALPLAFAVHEYKVLASDRDRLDYIGKHPGRLAHEVILEREMEYPVGPAPPGRELVAVREYLDQKLVIGTNLARPGIIVMSESYYPGWKAQTADGFQLPVMCANHAFRAVWVPDGPQSLTLTFQPAGFRIGLWVSIMTLGVMGAAALRTLRARTGLGGQFQQFQE